MKVTDKIQQSNRSLFSFELLPPLKGQNFGLIQEIIDPLMEFRPAFISVTYHQQEVIYKPLPNGLAEKKAIRKRPGTVGISAAIQYHYGVDVVPHIICGGFSREETENALIDLHFLDIENLLVLRGDPPAGIRDFQPEPDGHSYASQLVAQIQQMNQGKYLDEELQNSTPTDFCLGVAAYPEKHQEAPNMMTDLTYLRKKVDAGADFIITQMFFDNHHYFSFVKQCRSAGIEVPIIPGIKPITNVKQINTLPKSFNIDLPDDLVSSINLCKSTNDVRQVGLEWAIQQSKELLEGGVPAIHYYTMGKGDSVARIAKELF